MKLYIDTETAGLKGALLTIQYSINREEIKVIRVSKESEEMQKLLVFLNSSDTVLYGYNIGFDLWKLYQEYQPSKPFACKVVDLYASVLTGKPFCYYNIVGGKAVAILSKIPKIFAERVEALVLEKLKALLPNYISVSVTHKKVPKEPELVSLQFIPHCSNKLKSLASKLFGEEVDKIEESFILPDFKEEKGCPIILPHEQESYENLWYKNEELLDDPEKSKQALKYAKRDIEYLFMLEDFLLKEGNTISEDHENNVCTHAVAYTKYKGFTTDVEALYKAYNDLVSQKEAIEKEIPINLQSSQERKIFLQKLAENLDIPIEGTSKKHLETILRYDDEFPDDFKTIVTKILKYKPLCQRIKQMEVLLKTSGKVYPDFRVCGTSSDRMAGAGGLNLQGVSREGAIRKIIKASCGGDFNNLEVNIAAFFFKDEELQRDLAAGIDLHTKTATLINSDIRGIGYAEALLAKSDKAHSKHALVKTFRNLAKSINFAILYFCESQKIADILKFEGEDGAARAAKLMDENFFSVYSGLKKTRAKFNQWFATADFETWAKDSVANMRDSIHNLFGRKRYIIFEKALARLFWENPDMLGNVLTLEEKKLKITRQRLKGAQSAKMLLRSACLGAASTIQKSVMRSCGNFPIQSSGSTFTKKLMAEVFLKHGCPIMNIHDELLIAEGFEDKYKEIKKTVDEKILSFRRYVPTLKFELDRMKTWADKS